MAASKEAQMDLTSCPICFETFNFPKYLPCLHSFCEGCLQTFIDSSFRVNSASKGISCPVCRAFVQKPDSVTSDKWAKEFPSNHLLVSIIDMNKAKTESRCCNACARDSESVAATSWCVNCCESLCAACVRYHRRHKQSSQHKVIDIVDIKDIESSLQQTDIFCSEHPEEKLKAFCHDHSAVCCMTCVMLTHRKCDNVQSVENAAESKKKSKEHTNLEESFTDMKSHLEKLVKIKVGNMTDCEKSISDIKLEINQLFDNLIKHVGQLRDKALHDVSAVEKEMLPNLESERDDLKCKISAIENDIQLLHTNTKFAPPAQYLQSLEKLKEQSQILDRYMKDKAKSLENVRISFRPSEKISEITKSLVTFGTIMVDREMLSSMMTSRTKATELLSRTPSLVSDMHIDCHACGTMFLEDGHILISKTGPKLLELWDDNCKLLSSLALPGYPYGIKMTSPTEGIVVIWKTALLYFKINDNNISEVKRVQVPVSRDFFYHNGRYYIGSDNKIIVQDSNHQHVRDIAVDAYVGYMAPRDDDTLCYTIDGGHELHCITLDGKSVFQYSHDKLQDITGVTVDCAGNIYVCGLRSKNVHQLNRDGQLQRIMFDNLPAGPFCISFSKDHDKVVIGCGGRMLLYKLT